VTLFPDLERQLAEAAARTTAAPASARSFAVRHRRATALTSAAVLLATIVSIASLSSGPAVLPALAIADKTYRAVTPGNEIVHFIFDTRYRRNGRSVARIRLERWQLGRQVRTRKTSFDGGRPIVAEEDTDGKTARLYDLESRQLMVSKVTPPAAKPASDPFATFRDRYRAGEVNDAGASTIDGRPVRKLRIKAGTRTITYFVNSDDGEPVAIQVFQIPRQYTVSPDGTKTPSTRGTGNVSRLTRVLLYEKLTATQRQRRVLRAPIPADAKRISVHPLLERENSGRGG